MSGTLPTTTAERKAVPIVTGVLDYFPAALAYVAKISKAGNDKHNPGEPMHHARGKSMDHADCIGRHLVDRGTVDPEDNLRHSGKVAWRALALLQEELEREEGAPLARAAKLPDNPQVPARPEPPMGRVPPPVQDFLKEAIPMPGHQSPIIGGIMGGYPYHAGGRAPAITPGPAWRGPLNW